MNTSSPHGLSSVALLAALALVGACSKSDSAAAAKHAATATLIDDKGKTVGTAELRATASGVEIELQVQGLPPGEHALHIHTVGKCHTPAPGAKAFTEAGAHFNPYGKKHGAQNPEGPHAGDLPNFTVAADGTAKLKVDAALVTLEDGKPNSLFQPGGTCLVIHAGADDYKTDPTGNAGDRLACGEIKRK